MAPKPLPKNVLRDALLAHLYSCSDFKPHPAQRSPVGTKYISAFIGQGGSAFAVEKSVASATPIWIVNSARNLEIVERLGLRFQHYVENSARNSNLKAIPGFGTGALLRCQPDTLDAAKMLIARIA